MFGIDDAVAAGSKLIDDVVSRIWPDATEQEKTKLEALKVSLSAELAIHATNQAEAANPSWFVAGWRPAVGWVCAIGLFYSFLAQPLLSWASFAFGVAHAPPVLDLGNLLTLLTGMLGLGVTRTIEGMAGVKRSTWPIGSK